MDKEQLAIARLQDAARLSEHRYKKPLMVTYSGGKDSQVLVALAERAGINFEVVNSHTTADAPETVYFIREQFKAMEERGIKCSIVMPRYKDKPVSMWTLIPQKLMPPTRLVRYCCAVLKENTGRDRFIATGVRWAESTNRKKNRGTMEFSHRDKEKRIILMGDNDEKRQLFETCNLKSFLNSKNFIVYIQGQIRSTIGDVFLDLANILEKSEPANIWFDAKKVLPEKDKEVLVKREKFGIEIAFLSYDGLWQEHDEYIVFGDVTHWAHLPEPPKEV